MTVRRVLLVDDEPLVRKVLRSYLEADGFDVVECDTGEAAIERVRAMNPRSQWPDPPAPLRVL